MANNFITMTKLRTIIRLYEDRMGLKTIAVMARTSRNTVKKYIHAWNSLKMSFDEFQSKSDTELHDLFCISDIPSNPNPVGILLRIFFLRSAKLLVARA